LNGILFPGGGLSLQPQTTFYKTAKFFFDQSITAYKKGDYFPIWGTCMGFQLLTILGADDHNVLEEYACTSYLMSLLKA
jgi:gamma-glutamyl hydrolase